MVVPAPDDVVPERCHEPCAAEPDRARPRVLIPCQYFPPAVRAGGAPRSIAAIVAQESPRSRIEIITRNSDLGTGRPFTRAETEAVDRTLPEASISRCSPWATVTALWRRLRHRSAAIDVLYLNSLFSPRYTLWPLVLMSTGLVPRHRILLAPRGELNTGALSIKPHRKRLVGRLLRRALGRLDVTWHASCAEEESAVRAFLRGRKQPVFIRNDPATAPIGPSRPDNSRLTVCFVARMVPIKNFELLLRAAGELTIPTRIAVAGPLEDQVYWRRCTRLIARLPVHVTVEVLGHLDPARVTSLLQQSDAMALPTLGENFGHAIAEALSVGCPVLVPDTTPWTQEVAGGSGWLIDVDDPEPLRQALEELAAQPRQDRHARRRAIARRYAGWWTASQMHDRSLFVAAFDRQPEPAR